MIQIKGIVKDITFQNEDSGFAVIQLAPENNVRQITCAGIMPSIGTGESIIINGEWVIHKKFGKQFEIKSFEIVRPTTLDGISTLLGSGLFSNIGPARAKSIIEKFGLETLDILDNEPQRLQEVPGIGKKFCDKIKSTWETQRHLRSLLLFLQGYGVTLNLALKIYKAYGADSQKRICENPYSLVENVWGVGFLKADQIAQKMGFTHDSYKRIRAGLVYIMQDAISNGHVYQDIDDLIIKATDILDVQKEHVVFSLDHAFDAKILIKNGKNVYFPLYYNAECFVAEDLKKKTNNKIKDIDILNIDKWLCAYQQEKSWIADPRQLDAVRCAVSNTVFLLTGGPGTGKTTTLQVIVSFFRDNNKKVLLAAPTGRAAQRMGSIANSTAKTLHRLLEFRPSENGYTFAKNDQNQLEADVVIVDEMSMIDLLLMRSLLLAAGNQTRLIFVGDNNQLPSVGAGNVLGDCILSNKIPHVNLTTVFRQAKASRIVTAAHEMISGIVPEFANGSSDDCFFLVREDPHECFQTIIDLVSERLPKKYNFDPVDDIQVLSPMHNGILGTDNLNVNLQVRLNDNPLKLVRGTHTFFLGDKVMQIRNNYDQGVFNGDIGKVIDIVHDESLTVLFDHKKVIYGISDLDELQAAYCISIHKSQGCEFKAVVIPVSTQHYVMLQRNLIYTAITRANKICVMVGSSRALSIAVKNNSSLKRNSNLAALLCE